MSIIDRIKEEIDKLRLALPWGACSAQKTSEALFKDEAYNEVMDALDRIVPRSGDGASDMIDDEKIYRSLVERIYSDVSELIKGADKRLALAYLEKQKYVFENGRQLGIMQEQARKELEGTDEKQKEQKPAWSEEDKRILKGIIGKIDHDQTYGVSKVEMLSFLKSLRPQPKPEWSEEDKEKLKAICTYLRDYSRLAKLGDKLRFNEYCDFLKSLRPSWKPSEEQMDALKELIDDANRAGWVTPGATELYEQLKKLT